MTSKIVFIIVAMLLSSITVPVSAQVQQDTTDEKITHYVYADPLPEWANFDSGVVDRAIKAWEDANPNLTFQIVSSPDRADLHIVWAKDPTDSARLEPQYGLKTGGQSNGVTISPKASGFSYTTIIATLGNEGNCFNTWFPNSPNTLARILEHEMGHFLRFAHTPDPFAIMHEVAPQQYYEIIRNFDLTQNNGIDVRTWCSIGDTAKLPLAFNYQIATDDVAGFGFSFYQVSRIGNGVASSPSPVPYMTNGCFGTGFDNVQGSCIITTDSVLDVKLHPTHTNSNKVSVSLWPGPRMYLTELEEANTQNSIPTSSQIYDLPANTGGTEMAVKEVENMPDFPAQYTYSGVKGMTVKNSQYWNSIITYVKQSEKTGEINLDFKKTDIDSKFGSNARDLVLLSDGSKISWTEKDTDSDVYLTIDFDGLIDQIAITKSYASQETVSDSSNHIPSWVKNNANLWSQGTLTDDDFVRGMQYLIQQGIIHIPNTTSNNTSSNHIPQWVKNNAGLWADGQLSDDEFIQAIQYMISNGIITIS